MIGVEIQGTDHKKLAQKLMDAGLLVLTAGENTLWLMPPLTITKEESMAGLAMMQHVLCDM